MNHSPIYYSLEAEEVRVSNNLKNLSKLVDDYGLPNKPEYLLEEIAFLERELKYIKEERDKRCNKIHASIKMAFVSA